MDIKETEGYKKLLAAAQADESRSPGFHNYFAKVEWVVERALHYAEKTGLAASEIIDKWEGDRNYWYMNYYQDSNQPLLGGNRVRVFETTEELLAATGEQGFRCPRCGGISRSPYACDSGKVTDTKSGVCDWKAYGLFGDLGKGVHIFVKKEMKGETIFMPIAWERVSQEA